MFALSLLHAVVALAESTGISFDLSNLAYAFAGAGFGSLVTALRSQALASKFATRMALVELRLSNIESAVSLRRPPAQFSPDDAEHGAH